MRLDSWSGRMPASLNRTRFGLKACRSENIALREQRGLAA